MQLLPSTFVESGTIAESVVRNKRMNRRGHLRGQNPPLIGFFTLRLLVESLVEHESDPSFGQKSNKHLLLQVFPRDCTLCNYLHE